jgi:hypothetical protein
VQTRVVLLASGREGENWAHDGRGGDQAIAAFKTSTSSPPINTHLTDLFGSELIRVHP